MGKRRIMIVLLLFFAVFTLNVKSTKFEDLNVDMMIIVMDYLGPFYVTNVALISKFFKLKVENGMKKSLNSELEYFKLLQKLFMPISLQSTYADLFPNLNKDKLGSQILNFVHKQILYFPKDINVKNRIMGIFSNFKIGEIKWAVFTNMLSDPKRIARLMPLEGFSPKLWILQDRDRYSYEIQYRIDVGLTGAFFNLFYIDEKRIQKLVNFKEEFFINVPMILLCKISGNQQYIPFGNIVSIELRTPDDKPEAYQDGNLIFYFLYESIYYSTSSNPLSLHRINLELCHWNLIELSVIPNLESLTQDMKDILGIK